jgi:hypothetical protein
MRKKLLHEQNGQKTFVLVFDEGEEVLAGLKEFADSHQLKAAALQGIGALRHITVGFFDPGMREYRPIEIGEQVEVLSLLGDVTLDPQGQSQVHAHVVVGKADGTAHGGHLLFAHVRPTLEVIVTETPAYLRRHVDTRTGLPLIRL